ncbi:HAD-IIA family hydrolase [Alicyclobacillaceae bacterium I2511]|nr:HAD-IIA family hydrolase [Alicyclobacillaceae bacterium I2511]
MEGLHRQRVWRAALLDLDGTLYRGNSVIPGAVEFVYRLRVQGIQPVFFTNNATRTPLQVVSHLQSMGIVAKATEVCTSAQATAVYIRKRVGEDTVGFIGELGLQTALREVGLQACSPREEGFHEGLSAAVMGLDRQVTYQQLAQFSRLVNRLGEFILTNADLQVPVVEGFIPGNGAVGSIVTAATGVTPYVVGKPNPGFVDYALQKIGVPPDEVLLIGDNPDTDLACGRQAGVYTIQVRTGTMCSTANTLADEVWDSVASLF